MIRRLACVLLAAASMVITVPAPQASAVDAGIETLTATPLDTWQTNGTVWAIQVVGDVAYVGGSFTTVRPPGAAPGTQEVSRRFAAAFDARTGALLPWNPTFSGTVSSSTDTNCPSVGGGKRECGTVWDMDVTPDGRTLYMSGDFTQVNGQWRMGLVGFDTATGAMTDVYRAGIYGRAMAVTATNTTVYVGGNFSKLSDGSVRSRLAAFSRTTGETLPWAPSADDTVRKLKVAPDGSKLVVGGNFSTIDGTGPRRLSAVTLDTGAHITSFNATNNFATNAWVEDIEVFGDSLYVAGEASGSINEGIDQYDSAGVRQHFDNCLGASHSVAVLRGVVYAGSHSHNCGSTASGSGMVDGFTEQYQSTDPETSRRYKLRAEVPVGDGKFQLLNWTPQTDDGNGPREMATVGNDMLWIGGEFTLVNDNLPQQGLTRFAYKDAGGVPSAPRRGDAPIAYSSVPGRATVTWSTGEDRDSRTVTYQVVKDGNTSAPVYSTAMETKPWYPGWMSWTDSSVVPGSTHTYAVRGVDPDGRVGPLSPATTVVVPSSATAPRDVPAKDGARLSYPLDESAGSSTVRDVVAGRSLSVGSRATLGRPGVTGLGGTAVSLSGLSGAALADQTAEWAKKQASIELWFSTSSSLGGRLAGMGNSRSTGGTSSSTDRVVYLTNDGRVAFGVASDQRRTLFSGSGLNDGRWHHVVATIDSLNGTVLYVDGKAVGSDPDAHTIARLNGYWRLGGDSLSGWPSRPSSDWFSGTVDQFALYTYPMTPGQVSRHYGLAGGPVADTQPPTVPGGVSAAANGQDVTVSWNASTDDDSVAEYRVYRGTSAGFTADDASQVARTGALSTVDPGVAAGTWYYKVAAVDPSGNVSAASSAASVTVTEPPPTPQALAPLEDTWVNSTSTGTNYGASWVMRSRGGTSEQVSYLKFRVPTVPAGKALKSATLALSSSANSWASTTETQEIRVVTDSSWSQSTMTWANRPAVSGTVAGTLAGIGVDENRTVTLDPATLSAYAGQDLTLAVVGTGADNAEFDTREAPSGSPALTVLIG
ncbi:CBM96 family carbohydrate-binding protein [Phycicoccus flavus]|uniref:LamG domain-containing protein n=1 Tax=Phycicoccus flavus TaxID=2502783 RepID=A0A8T6QYH9_9MICO|nr:DNRLRE domain-containing protein [Phycicoccus flavus]NHA66597.1 LamG domain-containing protein [Phycicoccus flavus]